MATERAAVERRAAMLGKSLSNYVRDLLLADARFNAKSPVRKKN